MLTGGPFAGKTTLAERLGREGVPVVREAAIRVIQELIRELGPERGRAFRLSDPAAFQERIARLQLESERALQGLDAPAVVLDRGLHDGVAYCQHWGVEPPAVLTRALVSARYEYVILLDTLTGFRSRGETGRNDDLEEALTIRDRIERVYRDHGYDPVRLPELPLEERLQRVKRIAGLD